MMSPEVYERARRAARFHLQVEVTQVAGRENASPGAPSWPAHVAAQVVRVFRGQESIHVGDSVEFDVWVDADNIPPRVGTPHLSASALSGARYLEVFLGGDPPHCQAGNMLVPVVLSAPSDTPVVRVTAASPALPAPPINPNVRMAPSTSLAAGAAAATALASKSSVPTSMAHGPAAPTALASRSSVATAVAHGPVVPTALAPDSTLPTEVPATAPPPDALEPPAPVPPPPPAGWAPLRRATMQARVAPPLTEIRPLRGTPTLTFPRGELPADTPPPLPPLPEAGAAEPWTPPALEPEGAGTSPERRWKVWLLALLVPLMFVMGGAAAFVLLRDKDKDRGLIVGPGGIPTIAEALQRARAENVDTIRILPGPYPERLHLDGTVRLVGEGPREEIIIQGGDGPALTVEGDGVVVTGVSLRCDAGPNNSKHPAVEITRGSLVLEECDVGWEGDAGLNRARAGACVQVAGTDTAVTLKGCRLHHGSKGLWVVAGARPRAEGCLIENNQVGVWVDNAGGSFNTCTMRRNTAVNVFAAGRDSHLELVECGVLGGTGDGVVFEKGAKGKVIGGSLQDHRGKGYHAVWVREKAVASLVGCDVNGNRMGVLVTDGGKAELSACKVHDNTGLALEVRGHDSSLDAEGCRKGDVTDNGEVNGAAWAFEDETTFRKPS
jgi:hypothetical protein